MNRKALFFLLLVVLLLVGSLAVEAKFTDKLKSGTGKIGKSLKGFKDKYLTKERLANYFVIGIVLFLLASLFIREQVKDNKYIYIVLALILGIVFTITMTGVDEYVWKKPMISDTKMYLLAGGPTCQGEGTYIHRQSNQCRQAILRTNKDGGGLPVFLIVAFVTLMILKANAEKLGLEGGNSWGKGEEKMNKFMLYGFSLLMGSMVATNPDVTKTMTLKMGGWIIVFLLYQKFSKDDMIGAEHPWRATAIAYFFVETVLNLFNSGLLWDHTGGVGPLLLLRNVGIGIFIAWAGGKMKESFAAYEKAKAAIADDTEADIAKTMMEEGRLAAMRQILFGKGEEDEKKSVVEQWEETVEHEAEEINKVANGEELHEATEEAHDEDEAEDALEEVEEDIHSIL